MKKTKSTGFTLIELLVVISIIAILMAIMMPALNQVRRQSQKSICGNNIRQMIIGMNSYAAANNGRYPQRANDAAPYKLWWRNDQQSVLNMMLDYVLSGSETSDLCFCPLRDKMTEAGGINPGIDASYSPSEIELSKYGKFLYVKSTGYFIGYSMFAGLAPYNGRAYYSWDNSGNVDRANAPRIAGSGKDVVITDFVQVREANWYASHTKKNRVYEGGLKSLYKWTNRRSTLLDTPAELDDINVGFGDGHVEVRKEFRNYTEAINTSDKRWYLY